MKHSKGILGTKGYVLFASIVFVASVNVCHAITFDDNVVVVSNLTSLKTSTFNGLTTTGAVSITQTLGSSTQLIISTSGESIRIGKNAGGTDLGDGVAIGLTSMLSSPSCAGAVGVGGRALELSGYSYCSVGIGWWALLASPSNVESVAIGAASLYNSPNCPYSVAIGYQALQHNRGSASAVAIGYRAHRYAIGSTSSIAIGMASLEYSGMSDYSVAVGYNALMNASNSDYSVGLGHAALEGSASSFDVIALGRYAGRYSGSSTNCIAIGSSAGYGTLGKERIAIGHDVVNDVNESVRMRGSLYLDGGTNIYCRSTFGSGLWTRFQTGITQETDPIWGQASNLYYTKTQSDAKFATGAPVYVESDPFYSASVAARITAADTNHWAQAYGWGNHSNSGYASSGGLNIVSNSLQVQIGTLDMSKVSTIGGTMTGSLIISNNLTLNDELALRDSSGGYVSIRQGTDGANVFNPIIELKAVGTSQTAQIRGILPVGAGQDFPALHLQAANTGYGPVGDSSKAISMYNWSNELVTILGNGNVGIGAVCPTSRLVVAGEIRAVKYYGDGSGLTNITAATYIESDPSWTSASNLYYSRLQADAKFVTGTPVYAESDPLYSTSVAAEIADTDTNHWAQAYSWGNHAEAGYAFATNLSASISNLQVQLASKVSISGDTMTGALTVSSNLVVNGELHAAYVPPHGSISMGIYTNR